MKFFEPHLYILLESHRIQIIFLWNNLIQVMIKDYFSYFITPFHVQHSWHFPFLNEYATGGGQGGHDPPHFNFRIKQGPKASFSNIRNIAFSGCSETYGPKISKFLPCLLQFLDTLWGVFIFSNYVWEINHLMLDLLKSPILSAGLSEKFIL